jgi:hypothetical protein
MRKISSTYNQKYNIILLAYEITKGMKSIGSKSLMTVKIDNHTDTVIKHQLNSIRRHIKNIASINIVIGFDKEKLKKKNNFGNDVLLIDNNDYEKYGQSYAIGLALNNITNNYPIIIISNYIVFKKNIFQNCSNKTNHIFCIKHCNNKSLKIGCTHNDNNVEYLCYDLNPRWSEIFLLQSECKSLFQNIIEANQNMMFFETINQSLNLYPTTNNYIYNNALITIHHK